MVVRNSGTKTRAKIVAKKFRAMGFQTSVFKKQGGFGISVKRKK